MSRLVTQYEQINDKNTYLSAMRFNGGGKYLLQCDCGQYYYARRCTSKYCSTKCRVRGHRQKEWKV